MLSFNSLVNTISAYSIRIISKRFWYNAKVGIRFSILNASICKMHYFIGKGTVFNLWIFSYIFFYAASSLPIYHISHDLSKCKRYFLTIIENNVTPNENMSALKINFIPFRPIFLQLRYLVSKYRI